MRDVFKLALAVGIVVSIIGCSSADVTIESNTKIIADPANGMLSTSSDGWSHNIDTTHYYDYNVPNTIEAPAEYTVFEDSQ